MATLDDAFTLFLLTLAVVGGVCVYIVANDIKDFKVQHEEDYGLGSLVTTTAEYECLTNDTFTGVVVGGDCACDPALTIRSKDGVERQITIEFLEPVA